MGARILVADADKTTRELITTVLAREGFEVSAAHDFAAVQARCRESPPTLVIASAALPGGAPAELCGEVRTAAGPEARILLLVAAGELDGTSPAGLASRLSCDAVLPRPFRYSVAREQMAAWGIAVERRQERRPAVSFSVPVVAPPAAFDVAVIAAPEPPAGADGAPARGTLGPGSSATATPDPLDSGSPLAAAPAGDASAVTAASIVPVIPLGAPLDPAVIAALESFVPPAPPAEPAAPPAEPRAPSAEPRAPSAEPPPEEPAAVLADPGAGVLAARAEGAEPAAATAERVAAPGQSAGGAPDLEPTSTVPSVERELEAPPLATGAPEEAREESLDELPLEDLLDGTELAPATGGMAAAAATPGAASARSQPISPAPLAAGSPPASPVGRDSFFGRPPAFAVPRAPAPTSAVAPGQVAAEAAPAAAASSRPAATAPIGRIAAAARQEAKKGASLPATLPPSGQLEQVPLPRILFELYVATFCGKVVLSRQGVARTVYVWNGLPVRVDSDRAEESLGRLLVDHGRITPEQHEAALALATERRISEAEALLAGDAIKDSELVGILREQTEQRLVNSFAWRDGSYALEGDAQFGESMILTEVHPLQAIWRGISEHYDLGSLMTYFAALRDRFVVATPLFEVHFERLGPFLRKLGVPALLDGKTTFLGALRSDDTRALAIAQALYVLLVTDMVRASQAPGEALSAPAAGDDEPSMSAPVDYRAITRVCDEVNREYLRVKESDYFDALRVEQGAPPEAVEEAYANTVRPFTLEALPAGLPEDVQHRASELCAALARARATLADAEQRERYIEAMRARYTRDEGERPGETRPGGPVFVDAAELDIDEGADQDRETRQLAERAYTEGLRLVRSNDLELAQQKLAVAVRLNGRESGYRVALARAILMVESTDPGRRRDAASLLQQALQLDPSSVEANFELARLLFAVGQAPAARPYIMRVLQRAPEHREARALLAQLVSAG